MSHCTTDSFGTKQRQVSPKIDQHGNKRWYNDDGQLHRVDGPAYERADGIKAWYINDKLHRVDGPAVEYADGGKAWYINDKLHREDGPAIEWADGGKEWWVNGNRHREDGPAYEWASGTKAWWVNGERHRVDGPAVECTDKEWWVDGKRHREDGPAYECADGGKIWYLNDKLHRVDGPAVENANGTKEWYLNGELHCVDGPAVERVDGYKSWWVNNKLHREDGPAVEYDDGSKEWYINGVKVPEWLVMTPSCDIDPKELFKIRNAQVRSEFVKKVGINRILTVFKAQIIESTGIYELLILQIGKRKRPYLRMQNPSTGEYQIEGVRPRCTTIKEALNYRNGLRKDQIDEINGEYMYQQGDVVLKPVGAKKFKSVPRILT